MCSALYIILCYNICYPYTSDDGLGANRSNVSSTATGDTSRSTDSLTLDVSSTGDTTSDNTDTGLQAPVVCCQNVYSIQYDFLNFLFTERAL